jgi:copper resistance protein C
LRVAGRSASAARVGGAEAATRVDSRAVDTRARDRAAGLHAGVRRTRVRAILPVAAALLFALASVGPVVGHAEVKDSNPDDGAVLDTPPTAISVSFTEGLIAAKSSIVLEGPGGELGSAAPAADGDDRMRLGGLQLVPGSYTVRWTAATDDGHIERGTLGFAISEPATSSSPATPTPVASASGAPSTDASVEATIAPSAATATPAPSSAGDPVPTASSGDVLLPIIAALALVGVIGLLVLRRTRAA